MSERLERMRRALEVVCDRPPVAIASTPCKLENPLNGRGVTASMGARMAANARRKRERVVGRTLATRLEGSYGGQDAFAVVLRRESPRAFDDDNLAASLKSVRDGMAERWGLDDADPRVTWLYDWRNGPVHVVVASLWALPVVRVEADPEFDASDYERPRRDAWADIRSDSRRSLALSPSLIRAKGGL